ncbi:MAG: hypothetical protein WCK67_02625 [bacterium]
MSFNVFNQTQVNKAMFKPLSGESNFTQQNQNKPAEKNSIFSNNNSTLIASNGRLMGGGRITNETNDFSAHGVAGGDDGSHFYDIGPKDSLGGWGTQVDIDGIYLDGDKTYQWNGKTFKGKDKPEDGIKFNDTQAITVKNGPNGTIILEGGGQYIENLTKKITGRDHR